jgi:hypothetical protein
VNSSPWERLLTDMEDELNVHEAALRSGNLSVVPEFTPPEGLGELPSSLTGRVRQLTERIGTLATFVQYQLVATEGDLKHLERGHQIRPSAVALYLDASV